MPDAQENKVLGPDDPATPTEGIPGAEPEETAAPEPRLYNYKVVHDHGDATGTVMAVDEADAKKQVTDQYENATFTVQKEERAVVESVEVSVAGEA